MKDNETRRFSRRGFLNALALTVPAAGLASRTALAADKRSHGQSNLKIKPDVSYVLETGIAGGRLVFIGKGGRIDGQIDPTLRAAKGDVVLVTLVNGEGAVHDISFPDFDALSEQVVGKGASTTISFRVKEDGEYVYFCTVPGHRQAGMEGKLVVGAQQAEREQAASIVRDPADLPPPLARRAPTTVTVYLETTETRGQLADGTTFAYMTFDGKVPGPFLRVRVGDTVELHLKNRNDSLMTHSIDLHAVTGPGGGSAVMQAAPGEEKVFTFKALTPGCFVYHCASPMVAHHISAGMYGMILVEPAEGLPTVDREFYVMQGEIYTQQPFQSHGHQEFSVDKLLAERPEYFVLNGAVGALTEQHPLKAKVGETVRIFFGVGGPNFTSAFHVIGEMFDRVYNLASLTTPAMTDVQTVLVPPGGATVVEFALQVPGRYILVDHALSRLERGLVGFLLAEGPERPELYKTGPAR